VPEEEGLRICGGKGREMQFARTGGRKLFDAAAKADFLGWYAASGNCVWAAKKAGFDDATVWRHRMNDPDFAAAFDRAMDQGVVRAKASLIERKRKEGSAEIDGGREVPEFEDIDPTLALQIVRDDERRRATGRQSGRAPRVATNAEVEAALVKRLAAFGRRVKAKSGPPRDGEGNRDAQRRGGGGSLQCRAQDPLHQAPPGPPPPGELGEDL
jgi:hypothetical protein